MNVHSSTIHNSQKVETAQIAFKGWMDKQIIVNTYNGIVLSHKKEGSPDTCYNVDEPQN